MTNGTSAEPLIRLDRVSKHYRDGDIQALDNVSLDVQASEFLSIRGASGSGKSTLLNMIGALDQPTSGEVFFRGQSLTESSGLNRLRAREIGFVFQNYYLLPNLTAEENVQIPMFEGDRPRSERTPAARRLLDQVGLTDRATHLPGQLSIGERQRVAIARAMANDPVIILADEPTGALDSQNGVEVMDLLSQLNHDRGTALIVVTHDPSVADRADKQIHIKDGRIV